MKIAIFHNFLDNIGGAELVDLIMARELNADIYTTNIDREKIRKMGFSTENIHSIGKVPINAPFRHEIAYWKFRNLNLKNKYDFFIIAGDWAMSAAVHNKPHFWYVFSPTRELWDLYKYTREKIEFWQKPIFDIWVFLRRIINKHDSKKVEKIIAISKNVNKRVKKYLNKESIIIHPPVETSKYKSKKSENYWLSVNRLIDHKRIDLQLKAFSKLPDEKLIIVGCYEKSGHFKKYADYIHKLKPKNVEIKSWVSNKKLVELYSKCKGLITTSYNEDFGLTPIEAMASGKPVIAPDEGGYKETINKQTGILINNINPNKIIKAIKKINKILKKNPDKFKKACLKQAEKFDTRIFIKKIKKQIKEIKNAET
ncbi:glycosyltransferase [Candidatus Pacearchaeota archaeon]|nr:glycosyltransferase [Candidatus Pacearchaeota archaeon]